MADLRKIELSWDGDAYRVSVPKYLKVGERRTLVEAEPMERERQEMLGLINDLLITIKTSTVHGSLIFYDRAKAFLRACEGDSRG